ncbi:ABC transporter ATP-binding protein [Paenibacillus sp. 1001270B_150601_E10]|uniref:ABC transporter ATP-binding protein n=1 Tax=Paenibacillus sp. 1001270B_150601_E10 TaxID=2787079 RepID=UPI00189FC4A3|nr:ABC transporter ATP-binding protein [Paenibacillus sp. 1001270B_150601_E10]
MSTIPNDILTVLKEHRHAPEGVLHGVCCDRTLQGGFQHTYVLLSEKELILVFDPDTVLKETTFTGYTTTGKRADKWGDQTFSKWMKRSKDRKVQEQVYSREPEWKVESIPLEKIESVFIVNLVASGLLVLKGQDGEERTLAAFTNSQMKKATRLASLVEKLKKQESLREEREESGTSHACPTCGMLYPQQDRKVCPKCMKKHAIFRRLLGLASHYRLSIVFIVLFMLLNAATGLAIPYLQGTVLFDQALGHTGPFAGQIALVIGLIVLFRTLSLLFGVLYGLINARLGANVAFDLKSGVFTAMQRLSLSFFQKKQTGQLMTRVNNDATELQYFFVDGISYFIVNAMNIVGILVILLMMDWKLTLLCFIPMPFVMIIIRSAFPKLWRLSWRRHRRVAVMNAIISDTTRGTRVVKAFGKERQEMERFQRSNMAFAGAEQQFNKMNSTVFPILSMLTQFGGLIIWAFGGTQVMRGELTFGVLMTFIHYIFMLYGPIQFMNNIAGWWSYCMSAAQRIFEIQDAVPDVNEKKDPIRLPSIQGEIEVNNISFGYEPNKMILKRVTMHARPGQMIGVVGHSGAGKSTLVNLISRLYDVNEGEIRIDGHDVRDLSFDTLREHIGIVSQETYVFMGTIAENIAYANPDCSMADILYAAKIAKAHDFIEKLPDGYDTIVGTGGHSLSGGEKQRLSIARAILHNPSILILDEATASLDTETELQIQEALETLIQGRTTIAIAHRLSTLRNADYLIVMDKGKVMEAGTHDELMETEGMYYELVQKHDKALQMRGVG